MKTKFMLPRLLMLFMFGLILNSCTANEDELQTESGKAAQTQFNVEAASKEDGDANFTTSAVTPPPSTPNENEPIIVKPRK